ncbi:MAG: hypothetical protein WBV11_09330 [Salegentibacter sp.]
MGEIRFLKRKKHYPFYTRRSYCRRCRRKDFESITSYGFRNGLWSLEHMECEIASKVIANEVLENDEKTDPLHPMVICFGDMGNYKGFYMHTDEWWGGNTSVLKMGYTPYLLKMGFKTMYQTLGGKVPSWGLPMSEIIGDHTIL